MDIEDIKKVGLAYLQVLEAKSKKEEKLDPVDPKALKKDFDDREDKDIDNDGDEDESDEYLHNRRKTISKAMQKDEAKKCAKESVELDEAELKLTGGSGKKPSNLDKDFEYNQQMIKKDFDRSSQSAAKHKVGDRVHVRVNNLHPFVTRGGKTTKNYPQSGHHVPGTVVKHGSMGTVHVKIDNPVSHVETVRGKPTRRKTDTIEVSHKRVSQIKESANLSDYTVEELEQIAELSRATLSSYVKKADKQANKAIDSYSTAAARRHDFAPDTPAMAKNAKKFAKRDAGSALARSKLSKMKEEVELDEASKKHLDKAMKIINARITKTGEKPRYPSYEAAPEDIKAAAKNLAKNMKEEVELDEMKQPFVVIDTADGNKVVAMASDEQGAKRSVNSAERPPMSIPDKKTLKIVKTNKKQFIGRSLNEQSTANYGPKDDTRDTWDKQLSTRKGEEAFVDMHKIETPEYVDAYSVNPKTFKALRMSVSNPKRRWNDQHIGDKKPVPNDGK